LPVRAEQDAERDAQSSTQYFFRVTKAQHLLAVQLLEKFDLTYVRLSPGAAGRFQYFAWNPLNPNNNGSPPVQKRGTIKAKLR
jgi:hypothetical protein